MLHNRVQRLVLSVLWTIIKMNKTSVLSFFALLSFGTQLFALETDHLVHISEWFNRDSIPDTGNIRFVLELKRVGRPMPVWSTSQLISPTSRPHMRSLIPISLKYGQLNDSIYFPLRVLETDTLIIRDSNSVLEKVDVRALTRVVDHLAALCRYEYLDNSRALQGFGIDVLYFQRSYLPNRTLSDSLTGKLPSQHTLDWSEESSFPEITSSLGYFAAYSDRYRLSGINVKVGIDGAPFAASQWFRITERLGEGLYSVSKPANITELALAFMLEVGVGIRLHKDVELQIHSSITRLSTNLNSDSRYNYTLFNSYRVGLMVVY